MNDLVRILAAWALVHESADDSWKAAVLRGQQQVPGEPDRGPESFVDGLAALVAEEKERLKASLGDRADGTAADSAVVAGKLDALGFELAELRGRIESLQASIDALAARGRD
jgi:hypothetical protein